MLCNFVSLKWAGWSARWMALTWPWSQYLWRCWSLHLNVAVYSKKFESRPVHLIHCLIQDLMVVLGIWLKILIIIANDWQTEHHLSVDVCKALKQHEATFRIQTFQWNVTWYISLYIYTYTWYHYIYDIIWPFSLEPHPSSGRCSETISAFSPRTDLQTLCASVPCSHCSPNWQR